MSELKKLMPELLSAAEILKKEIPDMQFVLPLADTLEESSVSEMMSGCPVNIKVISGQTYDIVSCADLALVASGTATLETALLKVPMVIVYKISLLSYIIGRLIVNVQNIGLVNIIAGRTIVPELVQKDASGPRIAREALSILRDEARKEKIIKELLTIRAMLGEPGAAIRAAQLALDML
jgi:lipid-A-disaccharide synthase